MFTGLVQAIGQVEDVVTMEGGGSRVKVSVPELCPQLTPGASIAMNGCCTTAVRFDEVSFEVELSPETLSKTTFGNVSAGTRVNLELPLLANAPLGGHFVSGHVDGCIALLDKKAVGEYWELTLALPEALEQQAWFIPKGSVALNGISLTINALHPDRFTVCIIPHTYTHTTLCDMNVGDLLHFEGDVLGKYVQRFLSLRQ